MENVRAAGVLRGIFVAGTVLAGTILELGELPAAGTVLVGTILELGELPAAAAEV